MQYQERRHYPRRPMPVAIDVRAPRSPLDAGIIRDIGGGGLLFTSTRAYRVGDRVLISFTAPIQQTRCRLIGTVVRAEKQRSGLPHRTAVAF